MAASWLRGTIPSGSRRSGVIPSRIPRLTAHLTEALAYPATLSRSWKGASVLRSVASMAITLEA